MTNVDTISVGVALDTRPMTEGLARLSREAASFSAAVTGAFRSAAIGGLPACRPRSTFHPAHCAGAAGTSISGT